MLKLSEDDDEKDEKHGKHYLCTRVCGTCVLQLTVQTALKKAPFPHFQTSRPIGRSRIRSLTAPWTRTCPRRTARRPRATSRKRRRWSNGMSTLRCRRCRNRPLPSHRGRRGRSGYRGGDGCKRGPPLQGATFERGHDSKVPNIDICDQFFTKYNMSTFLVHSAVARRVPGS